MDCIWPWCWHEVDPNPQATQCHSTCESKLGIMYFHVFTGCDVVSAFRGKGKKSACQTGDVFDEVTETFSNVSQFPTEVTDADLKTLERFVVLVYVFLCPLVWTKRGCTCLPASSNPMIPFHQPKQLYGNILTLCCMTYVAEV